MIMETFVASPAADIADTHFEGVVISMPFADVVRVVGRPHSSYGPGGKTQFEWTFRGEGGSRGCTVTLYDYKSDVPSPDEWHVGAARKIDALAFKAWFESRVEGVLRETEDPPLPLEDIFGC